MYSTQYASISLITYLCVRRTKIWLDGIEEMRLPEEQRPALVSGTHNCPAYVSPEILVSVRSGGAIKYDGRAADSWCLGVILATMLLGRYPFCDLDPAVLFQKIASVSFCLPDSLSAYARLLIRALLRRNPDERLSTAGILKHPWMTVRDIDLPDDPELDASAKRARYSDPTAAASASGPAPSGSPVTAQPAMPQPQPAAATGTSALLPMPLPLPLPMPMPVARAFAPASLIRPEAAPVRTSPSLEALMHWARLQPNAPMVAMGAAAATATPSRPSTRHASKRAHDIDDQCVPGF